MKTASIIAVGTELMNGKMDDTNSTFLSKLLGDNGIKVLFRLNVDDTVESIVQAAAFCAETDLIIFTGGLGPTEDDLTREGAARYLGKSLIFMPELWEKISVLFSGQGRPIYESNKKQAYIIEGSQVLENKLGSAPGLLYNSGKQLVALLPGPPVENKKMVHEILVPKLRESRFFDTTAVKRVIRIYGAGESRIADLFKNISKDNLEIGYYFSAQGWIEVHFKKWFPKFTGEKSEEKELTVILDKKIQPFLDILDQEQLVYTPDEHLSTLVVEQLVKTNKKIAFAESITGGALAAGIVENDGASQVFNGGIVSYSNGVKSELLNVTMQSLIDHGAVSPEVAEEMALGLTAKIEADLYVAITGIAGPTGNTLEKPLGLVYFGFLFDRKLRVVKEVMTGDRQRVINKCINYVYIEVYSYLKSLSSI